jgi:hypothetical protein
VASKSWINLSALNSEEFAAKLQGRAGELKERIRQEVAELLPMLRERIREKLGGPVLKRDTGQLQDSITIEGPTIQGDTIQGSVGIGVDDERNRMVGMVHTKGHAGAYEIAAVRSKALAIQLSPKQNALKVFARRVVHPAIPATPFVSPVAQEARAEIIAELTRVVDEVLSGK